MIRRCGRLGRQVVLATVAVFLCCLSHRGLGQQLEPCIERAREFTRRGQYEEAFAVLEATIVDGQIDLQARTGAAKELLAAAGGPARWGEAAAVYERCLVKTGAGSNELYKILLDGFLRAHREAKLGLAPLAEALQSKVLPFAVGPNAQSVSDAVAALRSAAGLAGAAGSALKAPVPRLEAYDEAIDTYLGAQSVLAKADDLYGKGELEGAGRLYSEVLASTTPDQGGRLHAATQLAHCQEQLGQPKDAEATYRQVWGLLVLEERLALFHHMADVYLKAEKYGDGLRLLGELADTMPAGEGKKAVGVLREAASVCVGLQRLEEAIGYYQRAVGHVFEQLASLQPLQAAAVQTAPVADRLTAWQALLDMALSDSAAIPEQLSAFLKQYPRSFEAACVCVLVVNRLLDAWKPEAAREYSEKLLAAWPTTAAFQDLGSKVQVQLSAVKSINGQMAQLSTELQQAKDELSRASCRLTMGKLLAQKHDFASAFEELHNLALEMPLTDAAPEALSAAADIVEKELRDAETAEQLRWRLFILYPDTEPGWRCIRLLPGLQTEAE